jgi:hypothetical protein
MSGGDRLQQLSDGSVWIEHCDRKAGWRISYHVASVSGVPAVIEFEIRPESERIVPRRGLSANYLTGVESPKSVAEDPRVVRAIAPDLPDDPQHGKRSRRMAKLDSVALAQIAFVADDRAARFGNDRIPMRTYLLLVEYGWEMHPQSVRRWVGKLKTAGVLDSDSRLTDIGEKLVNEELRPQIHEAMAHCLSPRAKKV